MCLTIYYVWHKQGMLGYVHMCMFFIKHEWYLMLWDLRLISVQHKFMFWSECLMLCPLHSIGTPCPSGSPTNLQSTHWHFGHEGRPATARHTDTGLFRCKCLWIFNIQQTQTNIIYLYTHITLVMVTITERTARIPNTSVAQKDRHKQHSISPMIREPSPGRDTLYVQGQLLVSDCPCAHLL